MTDCVNEALKDRTPHFVKCHRFFYCNLKSLSSPCSAVMDTVNDMEKRFLMRS